MNKETEVRNQQTLPCAISNVISDILEKTWKSRFDIAVAIFSVYSDGEIPAPLYRVVEDICGSTLRVIEAKTAANVPPTREEVEFLIREAKKR